MKEYSTTLIIRVMQIKTPMKGHFHSIKYKNVKSLRIQLVRQSLILLGRTTSWHYFGKQFHPLVNLKKWLTYIGTMLSLVIYPRETLIHV